MRQPSEVVVLVAAHIELTTHIEVGQLAGCQAGDVLEVVNLEPAKAAHAANMNGVDVDPLVNRGRGEDPPGAGPQVPGQQEVALDVGHGQVVAALASRPALTQE